MNVLSGTRRAERRSKRSLAELDSDGRANLRRLLSGAYLTVLPTSDVIKRIASRIVPGSVGLSVAHSSGVGIDHTIAVSEVLAARGYTVVPHLAASQFRTARQLDDVINKLARKEISRVLLVHGDSAPAEEHAAVARIVETIGEQHSYGPTEVGIVGYPDGLDGRDRARLAADLMELAPHASFVSTVVSVGAEQILSWVTEMRVRGLELPIEVGIPGVVSPDRLLRVAPSLGSSSARRRGPERFDPTRLAVELAGDHVIDRLNVTSFRIETLNEIDATSDWRQQIYDLATTARAR